jgi:hypothetical protein
VEIDKNNKPEKNNPWSINEGISGCGARSDHSLLDCDEVELLDSRECSPTMSRVRVLKGEPVGEVGYLITDALSTIKP